MFSLLGTAARTDFGDGRYGRGVELGGSGGGIHVTGLYDGFDTPDLYAWWKLHDTTAGLFWQEECRFEVGLDAQSRIYVKVHAGDCEPASATTYTSTITWPDTTNWYHLLVHRHVAVSASGQAQQKFALRFHFGTPEILDTVDLPATTLTDVYFGRDLDGRVDELQAADYPPNVEATFDYDPEDCGHGMPAGTVCSEATATALAANLGNEITWDLPVRYKLIYDADECDDNDPCRVVFVFSGGGSCADNYAGTGGANVLSRIVSLDPPQGRSHLAVVTPDPICWTPGFEGYPDEISQILAVKADLQSASYLDWSGDYYATGCSHGAGRVLEWVVKDEALPAGDQPKRVFARSAGGTGEHPDCEYHTVWCGEKQEAWDEVHFLYSREACEQPPDPIHPHEHDNACVDDYIEDPEVFEAFVDLVDQALVQNHHVGRSWGKNTIGDVCGPSEPSEIKCPEEGGFAATDGGRQFRDAWKAAEVQHLGPTTRNSFFIENDGNCRHCGLTDTELDCVVDYLEGGRGQLSSTCLQLDEGDAAEDCSAYPE